MAIAAAIALVFTPFVSRPVLAQDVEAIAAEAPAPSGSVAGSVRSAADRGVVPDAQVIVEGTRIGAVTDAGGRFRIAAVPAGRRTLLVRRIGYAERRLDVVVEGGRESPVTVVLREAAAVVAPVVVSASREAQRRTDVSATIDLLDGAELRRARAAHPAEVMNRLPGVHATQTSGEGHMMAIRQPISTKPLYLYLEDGVPTRATGFFNHNALYEVNLPQAGGIEVLKGPGTALYGSDAIGGVVNVLTRPAPARPTVEASLEGGGHGYARLLATAGTTRGLDGVRADLNLTRADGWREAAAYDRTSATVRWDRAAANGLTVRTVIAGSTIDQRELASLTAADYAAHPERNTSPIGFRAVEALRLSTAVEMDDGRSLWSLTPYARYDVLELMPVWQLGYDPEVYGTRNSSLGLLAKYRRDLAPLRTRLIAGADLDWSPGRFSADGIAPARDADGRWTSWTTGARHYDYDVTYRQISPYVHAELSPVARLRIDAGVRWDVTGYAYDTRLDPLATGRWRRPADTTLTYRRLSPKVGITYDLADAANVFVSYREGFRAPSQGQLFQQGSNASTTSLDPVTVKSVEAGVRGQLGARVLYSVSAYEMTLHDDILAIVAEDGTRTTSNAGETRHRGIEASLGVALLSRLRLDASWAVTDHEYVEWTTPVGSGTTATNRSFAGKTVEGAPVSLASLMATWSPPFLRGGKASVEWSHTGPYWMDPDNAHRYDGHELVAANASWLVGERLELFGRVVNALDERYAELATFNANQGELFTPGTPRTVYAGVRWGWTR
ncbi:MAG TPA: TonB-dependent receptor [Gemmatimonadaceae bacterium]